MWLIKGAFVGKKNFDITRVLLKTYYSVTAGS